MGSPFLNMTLKPGSITFQFMVKVKGSHHVST